jgi:hypothetical protein
VRTSKISKQFFSPVDPFFSHSQRQSGWCVVDRDSIENSKMIFDFYSVNCQVWSSAGIVGRMGKVGRDVVKNLIISDNQAFVLDYQVL